MTLPQPRESIVRVDSPTEQRNPATEGIDRLPTVDVLRMINSEDRLVPGAVADVLPQVARAVDHAVTTLRSGGRVHYVGAGTSGRLATLDAAERRAVLAHWPPDVLGRPGDVERPVLTAALREALLQSWREAASARKGRT